MKHRTTQKAVRDSYHTIISVPYCGLQQLLIFKSPVAYTTRREGWAADIYDMGDGVAIVTGHAPFGNVHPANKVCRRYDDAAREIWYSRKWEEQKPALQELTREFLDEVTRT